MKHILAVLFTLMTWADTPGLKVGDPAPNIELKGVSGQIYKLNELKKKTALVFYRGSWCPYCLKQLQSIQSDVIYNIGKNSQLLVISVDHPIVAKRMKLKNKFSFDVISDQKAKSLIAFKIVNKLDDELVKKYKESYKIDIEGDSGEVHHMVAHPGVFIIDNGKVIYSDVHTNYKDRTKNSEIIKILQ